MWVLLPIASLVGDKGQAGPVVDPLFGRQSVEAEQLVPGVAFLTLSMTHRYISEYGSLPSVWFSVPLDLLTLWVQSRKGGSPQNEVRKWPFLKRAML